MYVPIYVCNYANDMYVLIRISMYVCAFACTTNVTTLYSPTDGVKCHSTSTDYSVVTCTDRIIKATLYKTVFACEEH
jgi:hypothetical protein